MSTSYGTMIFNSLKTISKGKTFRNGLHLIHAVSFHWIIGNTNGIVANSKSRGTCAPNSIYTCMCECAYNTHTIVKCSHIFRENARRLEISCSDLLLTLLSVINTVNTLRNIPSFIPILICYRF